MGASLCSIWKQGTSPSSVWTPYQLHNDQTQPHKPVQYQVPLFRQDSKERQLRPKKPFLQLNSFISYTAKDAKNIRNQKGWATSNAACQYWWRSKGRYLGEVTRTLYDTTHDALTHNKKCVLLLSSYSMVAVCYTLASSSSSSSSQADPIPTVRVESPETKPERNPSGSRGDA